MSVDTPARIAILGAGPIGLETALYARYLGYDVDLYERGEICANMRAWGHVPLFTPFHLNASPLGLAALAAQNAAWRPPPPEAILTGRELAEAYFLPLAESDLLAGHVHRSTTVVGVGREGLLKGERLGRESRRHAPFRILLDTDEGERVATADVVVDTTGTYGHPNALGRGGIPARGERAAAAAVERGLPDPLEADRATYAGRQVLLVGAGYSAATTAVALARLADEETGTQVTWITRHERTPPVVRIAGDRLAERDRLAEEANRVATSHAAVLHRPQTTVERIVPQDGRLTVQLAGAHAGEIEVDRIVANVGYRPDRELYRELQVQECYASEGPLRLAAALLEAGGADCLDQASRGPETLLHPEPDFYIVGAKSYGRGSQFLISVGHQQIRELFGIVGDRSDLDLYANMARHTS